MRTITAPGRTAVSAALAGIAVIGMVTSCSKQSTLSQRPSSSVPAGPGHLNDPLWNPCNSMSADALRSANLDPTTKAVGIDSGVAVKAFEKSCAWTSTEGPYQVGVATDRATQDQFRANADLVGFTNVQVGPRAGLTYDDKVDADSDKLECYVGIPYSQGTVEVYLYWRYSERDKITQSPPCGLALSHAIALEPYLPK
jgi:hypothetical protein